MADLRLSLAISDYIHTSDILTGRIKPVGIELIVNSLPFEQAAFRFGVNLEFDISEYSMANYCARVAAPDPTDGGIAGISLAHVPAQLDLRECRGRNYVA